LPDWVGGIAVGVGGLAWGVTWPLSAALFISALIPSARQINPQPRRWLWTESVRDAVPRWSCAARAGAATNGACD